MKTIFLLFSLMATLLFSGCSSDENGEKALEISRLQIKLSNQQGARAAEIEYREQQASYYLGCKEFFNRCSPETIELGQKLLQVGYTGTTSGWYWAGLLGRLICVAIASAVFLVTLNYLHLWVITPKKEAVNNAQNLIDSAELRARTINLRSNELERRNGQMKKELSALFTKIQRAKKASVPIDQTTVQPAISYTKPKQTPEPDY